MPDSILDSIKKVLGIDSEYDVFDPDITMHINSVFATLNQIGVGPSSGFFIADNVKTWAEFTGNDLLLNSVKSYMYLKVRLLHDPPATSFALDSMTKMATEFEWRLQVAAETLRTTPNAPNAFWWAIRDYEGFPPEAQPGDLGYDPETGNVWRKI